MKEKDLLRLFRDKQFVEVGVTQMKKILSVNLNISEYQLIEVTTLKLPCKIEMSS